MPPVPRMPSCQVAGQIATLNIPYHSHASNSLPIELGDPNNICRSLQITKFLVWHEK